MHGVCDDDDDDTGVGVLVEDFNNYNEDVDADTDTDTDAATDAVAEVDTDDADTDADAEEDYEQSIDSDNNDHDCEVLSKNKHRIRQPNIVVPRDDKVCTILHNLHLKKFLRRKIGKMHVYSVKESHQIITKSACFIAFVANKSDCTDIDSSTVIRLMKVILHPKGHKLLYSYCEYLGGLGYKPTTLTHTIDYVKIVLEWASNEIQQLQNVVFSRFEDYARRLRVKVRIFVVIVYYA